MNTFDFEYKHPSGATVIVEVDYEWDEPYSVPAELAASDWDYYGGMSIDGIRIYSGMDQIFDLEIPVSDITKQFAEYMEDIYVQEAMLENQSF